MNEKLYSTNRLRKTPNLFHYSFPDYFWMRITSSRLYALFLASHLNKYYIKPLMRLMMVEPVRLQLFIYIYMYTLWRSRVYSVANDNWKHLHLHRARIVSVSFYMFCADTAGAVRSTSHRIVRPHLLTIIYTRRVTIYEYGLIRSS